MQFSNRREKDWRGWMGCMHSQAARTPKLCKISTTSWRRIESVEVRLHTFLRQLHDTADLLQREKVGRKQNSDKEKISALAGKWKLAAQSISNHINHLSPNTQQSRLENTDFSRAIFEFLHPPMWYLVSSYFTVSLDNWLRLPVIFCSPSRSISRRGNNLGHRGGFWRNWQDSREFL
jgi:hypothetical protein